VGHRILVLDQSMIMAALDNALRNRALQRHIAADPVSQVAYQPGDGAHDPGLKSDRTRRAPRRGTLSAWLAYACTIVAVGGRHHTTTGSH